MPNTSLREAAPTAYLGSGSIERSRDARYKSPFSTRGCANGYAQDKLSTSAQCLMPNAALTLV
ncbi:MAG: hypothetical protein V7K88_14205 [Nostoc sp.]